MKNSNDSKTNIINEFSDIINEFSDRLNELKEKGKIEILYRGVSKEDAFKVLDSEGIEQYAKKLFFFGDKAKNFIGCYPSKRFGIDDVSDETFNFIFEEFNKLKNTKNENTKEFIKKNEKQFNYFFDEKNKENFINNVKSKKNDSIKNRNYLFLVLHQIGEFTQYKKKSHFVSSSKIEEVAKHFSNDGIIIKFWRIKNFDNEYSGIYRFNSFVYPEQEEDSVYTAIFPHYILYFEYKGKQYFNPYLKNCTEIDSCIYNGFDIIQKDFESRLKNESIYDKCVKYDGENYYEVKVDKNS